VSINLTRPTPVIPVVPAPVADLRNALMHALSVAETVAAGLADLPTSVSVADAHNGAYRVELYFHHEPEQVARFADQFGADVSVEPHYNEDSSTFTSADAVVDGVAVRGWALVRHEAVAA
jgi:hypothetical protein